MGELKKLILKPGKERAINNRHPWVFSGAIAKTPDVGVGSPVYICQSDGKVLALAHFCASTGLCARIFSFDPDEKIDDHFWQKRFEKAHQLRKVLGLANQQNSAFRLIHGEGDHLSGLVCDIFSDTASIELSNPGLQPILPQLCDYLSDALSIKHIFLKSAEQKQGRFLKGLKEQVIFLENGLNMVADVAFGQKTGYFLDQAYNRKLVGHYAQGKKVLDAFCNSGGFSINALKNGAISVISVDSAQSALDICAKNISLNEITSSNHKLIKDDCFSYLRQIKKNDFDLIVLDPPAFAKSKDSVDKAARGYKDINMLALKALKNGLLFTFSCSQHISPELFKKIIYAAAKDSHKEVRILHELVQGADHPVSIYCPQGSYLKGLALFVG